MKVSASKTTPADLSLETSMINLLDVCNYGCQFCFQGCEQGKKGRIMPIELCEGLMDDLFKLGVRSVTFSGGEATLYPKLERVLRYAKEKGFETIRLLTNGRLYSDEFIKLLKTLDVGVGLSFHCDLPEIHDGISQKKGSHHSAVQFIKKCVAHKIELATGMVLCGPNDNRVQETANFLQGLGVENICASPVRAAGKGKNMPKGAGVTITALQPNCAECIGNNISIDVSGEVLPCPLQHERSFGSIHDMSLEELVFSEGRRVIVEELMGEIAELPELVLPAHLRDVFAGGPSGSLEFAQVNAASLNASIQSGCRVVVCGSERTLGPARVNASTPLNGSDSRCDLTVCAPAKRTRKPSTLADQV